MHTRRRSKNNETPLSDDDIRGDDIQILVVAIKHAMKPNFHKRIDQNIDICGIFRRPAEIPASATGLANLGLLQRRSSPLGKVPTSQYQYPFISSLFAPISKTLLDDTGLFLLLLPHRDHTSDHLKTGNGSETAFLPGRG